MILFANGCSWTFGGSLNLERFPEKRLASVWPHHLGKLLGANEVVNLGEGCGSNQRMLRTTFNWLSQQTPERLSETVAVIQWTDVARYEYYQPETNDLQENLEHRWAKVKIDVCLQDAEEHNFALERSRRRLETLTVQEESYQIITNCAAMSNMMENFGVKEYYFWTHTNYISGYLAHPRSYYGRRFPWIDHVKIGKPQWHYDRIGPNDAHPSLDGHRQIAEIIYNQIR